MANDTLPGYITAAKPVPQEARAPWYKNTAPTYAGIMLWFVFWQDVPTGGSGVTGGILSEGLGPAILGLVVAALLCHFLFYLVPGLLGLKSGLPLYIVGTSTYGAQGGFFMPGFLMGILQFGWLGVNAFFSSLAISALFGGDPTVAKIIMVIWVVLAAFVGLKGIKYVASVATYFPIIPLAILVILFVSSLGSVGEFEPQNLVDTAKNRKIAACLVAPIVGAEDAQRSQQAAGIAAAFQGPIAQEFTAAGESADAAKALSDKIATDAALASNIAAAARVTDSEVVAKLVKDTQGAKGFDPLTLFGVLALAITYVVGFFATAGAAGVDFGMNNPDGKNVQMGGLVGIAGATIIAGAISLFIAAGGFAKTGITPTTTASTAFMTHVTSDGLAKAMAILLAVAAFPPACFSSFIAANSFKTTLPNVNPFASVGVGALVSIALAVSGAAGEVISVFKVIGASFGPVCGAMMVDYLLSGRKWSGPRAGWNMAGWISWIAGFLVGLVDLLEIVAIPAAPMAAFIVGAALYYVLATAGLQSKQLSIDAEPAAEGGAES